MPTIAVNGVELNYRLEGPEGAPVVAFSNSLGTTLAMWDAQARALSSRFRCLRYDTRGHGRSPVVETAFAVDDLAADLGALLDALGIARAHVIGLSLGGMTGQILGATRPEKIDRLALVATSAHMPPESLWRERAETVRARGMAAIAESVVGRWFTPEGREGAGARETLRVLLEEVDPRGYARACEAIATMDLRERIGAITAPTLVVSGQEDPATPPAMGEEIHRKVAGSRFVVMERAAHLIAVERPDELTRVLGDFLDGAAS